MLKATVKTNPNFRTTVNTRDLKQARVMGIQGGRGIQGIQGEYGIQWTGLYDVNREYVNRDAVTYLGSSYIYIGVTPSTGIFPTDTLYWDVLVEKGDQGDLGQDKTFPYEQHTAESVWDITHGLEKFPSVTVIDSGGTNIEGNVLYLDENNIRIIFSDPFTGKAYLN